MITISKCFSVLIASGNGHLCKNLKDVLYSTLLCEEKTTGLPKVMLFKYGRPNHPELVKNISKELAKMINPITTNVDSYYFCSDLKSISKA